MAGRGTRGQLTRPARTAGGCRGYPRSRGRSSPRRECSRHPTVSGGQGVLATAWPAWLLIVPAIAERQHPAAMPATRPGPPDVRARPAAPGVCPFALERVSQAHPYGWSLGALLDLTVVAGQPPIGHPLAHSLVRAPTRSALVWTDTPRCMLLARGWAGPRAGKLTRWSDAISSRHVVCAEQRGPRPPMPKGSGGRFAIAGGS